jgi:hypothetical protein
MAACWTAERVRRGVAVGLPTRPPRDSRGLRMEIVRRHLSHAAAYPQLVVFGDSKVRGAPPGRLVPIERQVATRMPRNINCMNHLKVMFLVIPVLLSPEESWASPSGPAASAKYSLPATSRLRGPAPASSRSREYTAASVPT